MASTAPIPSECSLEHIDTNHSFARCDSWAWARTLWSTFALDADGRLDLKKLKQAMDKEPDRPTVICLMAGDLNTGAADPFEGVCALAKERNAWVHVDGAFGLWMNASPEHRESLRGVELADSWATDGHKWLQLPFDHGFAFIPRPRSHTRRPCR